MDKRALFLEDGSFAAPRTVRNIEDVPETHRDWYLPEAGKEDGRYILNHEIWKKVREPYEREVERIEKAMADLKAKHETDLEREKQVRKREKIDATLRSTCEDAGIPAGLIEGVIALLSEESTFEVDDSYEFGGVVIANSNGTLNSVEALVENFLDSDEGAAFRGKRRAAPSDGYFASLIAGLKERR
ncbi:THO complex subunit 7 family protein [Mesorhizobium tianshanense]|uniref:Uncharacterized protein n=1 Tax=Mesorhizobium tianshanense TaxID=39844 RepID=A0A562NM32_9HYPH|nr:hypothetical protein [Mesorhizobium tianshanense]TWI33041.1 hypothetical protein IQ26_04250 [Mesorhizobium tianshanense]